MASEGQQMASEGYTKTDMSPEQPSLASASGGIDASASGGIDMFGNASSSQGQVQHPHK